MPSRYRTDPLATPSPQASRSPGRDLPAAAGLVVEDAETGWCGAVVRVEKAGGIHVVHLEDRRGRTKGFPLGPGFLVDGEPVALVPPAAPAATGAAPHPRRTNSGSYAVAPRRARVARASRLFVEGRHDAELVEHVWGADLRVEGIVVEQLDGADHLPAVVAEFRPGPGRRMGVLLDHVVTGSKETRLIEQLLGRRGAADGDRERNGGRGVERGGEQGGERGGDGPAAGGRAAYLKVVGHPYVDVWQAVRPERLGLARWPEVGRDRQWKEGALQALGWPCRSPADVAEGWRRILAAVRTYADLEPALLAPVEELIDFVTQDPA